MLISTSAALIFKGALFLWKAHGTHLALMKGVGYLYSTYGLATTVTTATTVAACAGCVSIANSTIHNSVEGYGLLRDGILEKSPTKVFAGLCKLKNIYPSVGELSKGFSSFLDHSNVGFGLSDFLHEGVQEIVLYAKDTAESQMLESMVEIEQMIREKYSFKANYNQHIENIYVSYFSDSSLCYEELMANGGKCYDRIRMYNASLGIGPNYYQFDHFLVFCMAGWIKDHVKNIVLENKSQRDIASDITNGILNYLLKFRK